MARKYSLVVAARMRKSLYDYPRMQQTAFIQPTGEIDPDVWMANIEIPEDGYTISQKYEPNLPPNNFLPAFSQAAVNRTHYTGDHRPQSHAWR